MIIVQVNSSLHGSTGNIMLNINHAIIKSGNTGFIAIPKSRRNLAVKSDNVIFIGTILERSIHRMFSYVTGNHDILSIFATRRFISKLKILKPDILQLHNLHDSYINLKMLFRYIKYSNIKVFWTLHDCWSFTGKCPYYTIVNCNKWETKCLNCPQLNLYPRSLIDKTNKQYNAKKAWFKGVENLTIITVSNWLKNEVKKSFLKDYRIEVIYNGLDMSIFSPKISNVRQRHNIDDKVMILGVANPFTERKGLSEYIKLSYLLDERYIIVLIGLTTDQIKKLPKNIIGLERTDSKNELIEFYSSADLLLNLSKEETMGMVTLESIACGTPAIVYKSTAIPEILCSDCGIVVEKIEIESIKDEILRYKKQNFDLSKMIKHAKKFDLPIFNSYIDLYNKSYKEL